MSRSIAAVAGKVVGDLHVDAFGDGGGVEVGVGAGGVVDGGVDRAVVAGSVVTRGVFALDVVVFGLAGFDVAVGAIGTGGCVGIGRRFTSGPATGAVVARGSKSSCGSSSGMSLSSASGGSWSRLRRLK